MAVRGSSAVRVRRPRTRPELELAGIAVRDVVALGRLPQLKQVAPYDPRFQEDRIGIWVPCSAAEAAKIEQLMKGHAAEEVQVHA